MLTITRALVSACTLLVFAADTRADDFFVGPGQAYTEIQPAIDAALPGDRVFVAPGAYSTFVLAKPVAILGAGAGLVTVRDLAGPSGVLVIGIQAGTEAVVAGLSIEGAGAFAGAATPPRLLLRASPGRVLVHDVHVVPTSPSPRLLDVVGCAQVVVSRCVFDATQAAGLPQFPVVARSSNVWIDGTEVRGPLVGGFDTAPAVDALNSKLFVQACTFVGGTSQPFFWPDLGGYIFGMGGPAIRCYGGEVHVLGGTGNSLTGGAAWTLPPGDVYAIEPSGGNAFLSSPSTPLLPPLTCDLVVTAGAVLTSGAGPGIQSPSIQGPVDLTTETVERPAVAPLTPRVAIGASSALAVTGAPSSLQWIFFALGSEHALVLPSLVGEVLVPPGAAILFASIATDTAGVATQPIQVPFVPALVGTLVWFQSVAPVPAGLAISAPSVLLIDA